MRTWKKEWHEAMEGARILLTSHSCEHGVKDEGGGHKNGERDLETWSVMASKRLPDLHNVNNAQLCLSLRGLRLELESKNIQARQNEAGTSSGNNPASEAILNAYRTLSNAEKALMKCPLW